MANIRLISMSGQRPFVSLHILAKTTNIRREQWLKWLLDEQECSVMFVRSQEGIFIEASSLEGVVRRRCTEDVYKTWKGWCSLQHVKKRHLSEPEKRRVASEQEWMCAMCGNRLTDVYEVDHIEQQTIRQNHSRKNLRHFAGCPEQRQPMIVILEMVFSSLVYNPTIATNQNEELVSRYFSVAPH